VLVVLGWSERKQLLDKDVYNDKNQDIRKIPPLRNTEIQPAKDRWGPPGSHLTSPHEGRQKGHRRGGPSAHTRWRGVRFVDRYEAVWKVEKNAS
jgi:hypothetical protein